MNIVHILLRRTAPIVASLRGVLRLLAGTTLFAGLCVWLADPQAPGRWLGALLPDL